MASVLYCNTKQQDLFILDVYTMLSGTLYSQGIMAGHDPNKVRLSHTEKWNQNQPITNLK